MCQHFQLKQSDFTHLHLSWYFSFLFFFLVFTFTKNLTISWHRNKTVFHRYWRLTLSTSTDLTKPNYVFNMYMMFICDLTWSDLLLWPSPSHPPSCCWSWLLIICQTSTRSPASSPCSQSSWRKPTSTSSSNQSAWASRWQKHTELHTLC